MLVHGVALAAQRVRSQERRWREAGVQKNRERRGSAGLARLRWQGSSRLDRDWSAGRLWTTGRFEGACADRRSARLVRALLLHPQGLSQAGTIDGATGSGDGVREEAQGEDRRRLSL